MAAPVKIFNSVKHATATAGTGTVTLGSASTGYLTAAEAGVADGDIVSYRIDDGNDLEIGVGVYTAAGTTLTRATVIVSKISGVAGTTKITLSGSATVALVLTASQVQKQGFGLPSNMGISCSVGSNILTVALKTADGADASEGSPIWIPFRHSTIATGTPEWVSVSAALSMTTNATGATLGTANSVPFRLWIVIFNNGGTPVLGLWQSVTGGSSPTAIGPLNEGNVASSTAISGSATAAATFYTPNGTTITSKSFRIIGYLDFASGLATAGSYASAPTTIQLFGPGIKLPGEEMQRAVAIQTANQTTTSSTIADISGLAVTLTPTAAMNIFDLFTSGLSYTSAGGTAIAIHIENGSTDIGIYTETFFTSSDGESTIGLQGRQRPGSASAQTWKCRFRRSAGAGTGYYPIALAAYNAYAILSAREIQV